MATKIKMDHVNIENLTEQINDLNLGDKPKPRFNRLGSKNESPASNNSKKEISLGQKLLIFENCRSVEDKLRFFAYNGSVQPFHKTYQNYKCCKTVGLQNSNHKSLDATDRMLFKEKTIEELGRLNEYFETLRKANEEINDAIDINAKLSIKLGNEYFFSKLYIWRTSITIEELHELIRYQIKNTDDKYYKPPSELPYFDRLKIPPNEKYELLRSSFTDHSTINNVDKFEKSLPEMEFEEKESLTTYRLFIKSNKQGFIERLFANYDSITEASDPQNEKYINSIKEKISNSEEIDIDFDSNFKLQTIRLCRSQDDSKHTANIDLIRLVKPKKSDAASGDYQTSSDQCNKFDVRFKFHEFIEINESSFKNFSFLQKLFDGFLSKIREKENGEKVLLVHCNPEEIKFFREANSRIFVQSNLDGIVPIELKLTNYSDYRVREFKEDFLTEYEPNVTVNGYIEMNASLKDILTKSDKNNNEENKKVVDKFIGRIWDLAIWLSDIASESL